MTNLPSSQTNCGLTHFQNPPHFAVVAVVAAAAYPSS